MNKNIMLVLLISVFAVAIISGCAGNTSNEDDVKVTDTNLAEFQSSQELKKFTSTQELRDFLKASTANSGYISNYHGGVMMMASMKGASMGESAPMADSSNTATDYSQTNVQVQGVDEADFVKNDNKYIYVISQDKLVIINAYPAEDAEILSETKIDGIPKNMFVNKDKLVVFAEDNDQTYAISEYDYMPSPMYVAQTHVYVYDISDREEPKLVNDYEIDGNYFESRMIGSYVYFIVTEGVYYYNNYIDMPVVKEGAEIRATPDVYYFDNPEDSYTFNTISSFNILDDNSKINSKTFMMGYSNNLYVSENNIYITYQRNLPYTYYTAHNEERFYNVVVPLLPDDVQQEINGIKSDSRIDSYEKWNSISEVLEKMYNTMDEDEKEELLEDISNAIEEYEAKIEEQRQMTVIHKIKIDKGSIEYDSRGEVPGTVLNQFSMDESGDYFRVATTLSYWSRSKGSVQYNNVFVLDSNLNNVGEIRKIAPGERIYSTRFMGDRLYMVTFKRVDPLFVIDLSDPEKPEILGELKIPGYSDYLHPYDETHIIGIGKETKANEWGGVSIEGLKLALFDVSDVANPKQIDTYEIGTSGTDSEALRDHKAFLFDKEKNILVIPVREVKGNYYDYTQNVWQGAYVFGVTPEDGFEKKGKVTHYDGDEEQRYYWASPSAVRRSLYMNDVLYTVSATNVKMNDLDDISEEINDIELPYEKVKYYDYGWY